MKSNPTRDIVMDVRAAEIRKRFHCPQDINIRFWLFVLQTGATEWRNNVDFSGWIQKQIRGLADAKPFAAFDGRVFDQKAFDEYLSDQTPTPKPAAVARALAYFNGMPHRQNNE